MNLDFRTMDPKPFMEIFPALIPVSALTHQALVGPSTNPTVISIPGPSRTGSYPVTRPSYETADPVHLTTFGPTERAPLGSIVHARSGDKANNSNVGFFVRNVDEYGWLCSLLTLQKIEELFGRDWNKETRVERVEFRNILAVHL
jgi:hypothetical protein